MIEFERTEEQNKIIDLLKLKRFKIVVDCEKNKNGVVMGYSLSMNNFKYYIDVENPVNTLVIYGIDGLFTHFLFKIKLESDEVKEILKYTNTVMSEDILKDAIKELNENGIKEEKD